MKTKIFAALAGLTLIATFITGCVNTVADTKTPAVWFGRDYVSGRYERTLDQVYAASIAAIRNDGTLLTEYIPHGTNSVVSARSLYGTVNDHKVWIRCDAIEPQLTEVTVQARTKWGNTDLDTAHEVEKEIALQLQQAR